MRKVERVREQRRRRSRTSFLRKRGREGEREEVDTELNELRLQRREAALGAGVNPWVRVKSRGFREFGPLGTTLLLKCQSTLGMLARLRCHLSCHARLVFLESNSNFFFSLLSTSRFYFAHSQNHHQHQDRWSLVVSRGSWPCGIMALRDQFTFTPAIFGTSQSAPGLAQRLVQRLRFGLSDAGAHKLCFTTHNILSPVGHRGKKAVDQPP